MQIELRISVQNTSDLGGTAFTPVFLGFHDGSFDIYNLGEAASAGLEALAEDGNNAVIAGELAAADADGQTLNVFGDRGPIAAGERASATLQVDGASNGFLSLAAMVLPSNDAFFGTADAVQLFGESGAFLGSQTLVFDGASVRDAGTEVNTELDAAFINQTAPNTGETEGGVVTVHPGFNGSLGNPGGEQIILGGTNAFGEFIDPVAADFTQPGAQIATLHVNVVERTDGTDEGDPILGSRADDLVEAGGGDDIVLGRGGWDVINAGDGDDFVKGAAGNDEIYGEDGNDVLSGGAGSDLVDGGAGNDRAFGGAGNDVLIGGAGRDLLNGGADDDAFVFLTGSEIDIVRDFDREGDDLLVIGVEGVESYEDAIALGSDRNQGAVFDFGGGDTLVLRGVEVADLTADDFFFV